MKPFGNVSKGLLKIEIPAETFENIVRNIEKSASYYS